MAKRVSLPVPVAPGSALPADGAGPAVAACACGCGTSADVPGSVPGDGRKAVAVDPDIKDRNRKRLRRLEGQIRGIQRMVDEDRYCADILTQVSAAQEALRAVGRELLRNHLTHCATHAIRSDDARAGAMVDEILDLVAKHGR